MGARLLVIVFLTFISQAFAECPIPIGFENFECSGTFKAKSLSDIQSYASNLGQRTRKGQTTIRHLKIEGTITGASISVGTHCKITVAKGTNLNITGDICLYSDSEKVRVAQDSTISAKDMSLTSPVKVVVGKNSTVSADSLSLTSTGSGEESQALIRQGSTITVKNLSLTSDSKSVLGKNSTINVENTLSVSTNPDNPDSNSIIRQGSNITASSVTLASGGDARIGNGVSLDADSLKLEGEDCRLPSSGGIDAPIAEESCESLNIEPPVVNFELSESSIFVGDIVTIDASSSTSLNSTIEAYEYGFGNGLFASSTEPVFQYQYNQAGNYIVSVRARDAEGFIGGATSTLEVLNRSLPIAKFKYGAADDEGFTLFFFGEATQEGASIVGANYTLASGTGFAVTDFSANSHTEAVLPEGDYEITLNVIDSFGSQASSTQLVTVSQFENNYDPVVNFRAIQSAPNTIFVDITDSFDPTDVFPGFTTIDWGDGTVSTIDEAEILSRVHTYVDEGDYTITVSIQSFVTGNTSQKSQTVNATSEMVPLVSPVASFGTEDLELTGVVRFFNQLSSSANGNLTFRWIFEDGSELFGASVVKFFPQNTTQSVTLEVTDEAGLVDTQTQKINIGTGPSFAMDLICEPIFDPSFFCEVLALDSQGELASITVDWGDGTIQTLTPENTSGTFPEFEYAYTLNDLYTVTATINTTRGESLSQQTTIHVLGGNDAPFASFTCNASDLEVTCDGSSSGDLNGDELSFEWNFGDNTPVQNGPIVSHTYADAGLFTITLIVTDSKGATSVPFTFNQSVVRPNILPVAILNCSVSGLTVSCDASGSEDPDGTIVTYNVDWEDGSIETFSEPIFEHTYQAPNTYIISLTVVDNKGESNTTNQNLNVPEFSGPTADGSCTLIRLNAFSCNSEGSAIFDSSTTYSWKSNGVEFSNATSADVIFQTPGDKVITLTLTDSVGRTSTKNIERNVPPAIPHALATCIEEPALTYTCDAEASVVSYGKIQSFEWTGPDGELVSGPIFSKTVTSPERQELKLKVTSDSGGISEAIIPVTIEEGHSSPVGSKSVGELTLRGVDVSSFVSATTSIVVDLSGVTLGSGTSSTRIIFNNKIILADELNYSDTEIFVDETLSDGRNVINVFTRDNAGNILEKEFIFYAGLKTIVITPVDDAGTPILQTNLTFKPANDQNFLVTFEATDDSIDGAIRVENAPTDTLITTLASSNNEFSSFIVEGEESVNLDVLLRPFSAPNNSNPDFSEGVIGWEAVVGEISIVDHVSDNHDEFEVPEGKKNAQYIPDSNGDIHIRRTIVATEANMQEFVFNLVAADPNDYVLATLRSNRTSEIKTFFARAKDIGLNPQNGIPLKSSWFNLLTDQLEVGEVIEYDIKYKVNQIPLTSENKLLKFISESIIHSARATSHGGLLTPGGTQYVQSPPNNSFTATLHDTLGRTSQLGNFLSLGPFPNYHELTRIVDSTGNFSQQGFGFPVAGNPLLAKINWVNKPFKVKKYIIQLKSPDGSVVKTIEKLLVSPIDGLPLSPQPVKGENKTNFLISISETGFNGDVLVEMIVEFFNPNIKPARYEIGSYETLVFSDRFENITFSGEDSDKGGDKWHAPALRNVFNLLPSVGDRVNTSILVNDISRINGERFPGHDDHKKGKQVDIRWRTTVENSEFQRKNKESIIQYTSFQRVYSLFQNHRDVIAPSIERVLVNYNKNDTSDFTNAVLSTCGPRNRLMRDVIQADKSPNHSDHAHVEIFKEISFTPESVPTINVEDLLYKSKGVVEDILFANGALEVEIRHKNTDTDMILEVFERSELNPNVFELISKPGTSGSAIARFPLNENGHTGDLRLKFVAYYKKPVVVGEGDEEIKYRICNTLELNHTFAANSMCESPFGDSKEGVFIGSTFLSKAIIDRDPAILNNIEITPPNGQTFPVHIDSLEEILTNFSASSDLPNLPEKVGRQICGSDSIDIITFNALNGSAVKYQKDNFNGLNQVEANTSVILGGINYSGTSLFSNALQINASVLGGTLNVSNQAGNLLRILGSSVAANGDTVTLKSDDTESFIDVRGSVIEGDVLIENSDISKSVLQSGVTSSRSRIEESIIKGVDVIESIAARSHIDQKIENLRCLDIGANDDETEKCGGTAGAIPVP